MNFTDIVAALAFVILWILGFTYIALGIAAYGHVEPKDRGDRAGSAGPWWAFKESAYDNVGKKYCKLGKLVVLFAMISAAVFYLAK